MGGGAQAPCPLYLCPCLCYVVIIYLIDISHLRLVRDALKESHFIDANWFDLGVELNLHYPDLANIRARFTDPSQCLLECLSLWLTSANNRTWKSLASALERMNQKPAATHIRETCKVNIHTYNVLTLHM